MKEENEREGGKKGKKVGGESREKDGGEKESGYIEKKKETVK